MYDNSYVHSSFINMSTKLQSVCQQVSLCCLHHHHKVDIIMSKLTSSRNAIYWFRNEKALSCTSLQVLRLTCLPAWITNFVT